MIRVARKVGDKMPKFPGFVPIVVLMKSSKYYSLSPYSLKDENDHIMENVWQFSKVYARVPKSTQYYSQYDKTIIWEHPAEDHYINEKLTSKYWNWHDKGFKNKWAVRYPVGFKHRTNCLFSVWNGEKLDYINARKKIYLPVYKDLVKKQPQFFELLNMLKNGINLLIIEVDGPHQESLDYYKKKYNVDNEFIVDNTILATNENMEIMLNDPKHNFGHGYCLAMALLECMG